MWLARPLAPRILPGMNFRIAINPAARQYLPEGFNLHDPVLEAEYLKRQEKTDLKQSRQMIRQFGGSYFCTRCHVRRISTNKEFCSECAAVSALAEYAGL